MLISKEASYYYHPNTLEKIIIVNVVTALHREQTPADAALYNKLEIVLSNLMYTGMQCM